MSRLSVILLLLALAAASFADDRSSLLDQKSELEKIKKEVADGQKRLDSLQKAEQRVQKAIGGYDEKLSADKQVIRRLEKELRQVQGQIHEGESTLVAHQEMEDRRRRRYLGDVRQFYMLANEPVSVLPDRPNDELEYDRLLTYLSALTAYESEGVEHASELVDKSTEELGGMTDRRKTISGLKRQRETSVAIGTSRRDKEQKNLDQVRRQSMMEADRVITLRKAAEEMASIIARLEEQRALAAGASSDNLPSAFAALKGQLLSPYRGKVTESFGEHVHPVSHLKSFSPGITIEGRSGSAVYAVASGTVAYSGNLRGYGNFVIINHDHQYYTTYANLGQITVSQGQFVQTRERIGLSGDDGVIKFELRKGREPLDPVGWISIESL